MRRVSPSDHPRFRDKKAEIPEKGRAPNYLKVELLPPFAESAEGSRQKFAQSRKMYLSLHRLRNLLSGKDFFLYWKPKLGHHLGDLEIQLGDPREKRVFSDRLFTCYGFSEEDMERIARNMDLLRPFGKPKTEFRNDHTRDVYLEDATFQKVEKMTGKKFWIPRHMKEDTSGKLCIYELYPNEEKSYVSAKYAFGSNNISFATNEVERLFTVSAEGKPHKLPERLRKLARKEAREREITIDSF